MEILSNRFGRGKDFERKVPVSLAPEASEYLRGLVMRPNPNLEEFAFLGLGQGNLVDQIVTADRTGLEKQGLKIENDFVVTSVGKDETRLLFKKLHDIAGDFNILALGHLHPCGQTKINGRYYFLSPSEHLLEPSMGNPEEGGPASAGDLLFFKELYKKAIKIPYVCITTVTPTGPKLRFYQTDKLIKIKRCSDIDKVPQTTVNL